MRCDLYEADRQTAVKTVPATTSGGGNTSVYVGPPYCRAEMYAGYVACCSLVNHCVYADGTDRRTDGLTPDRYISLFVRRGQRKTKK